MAASVIRATAFEHIYRRYRITEGSEQIQRRKVAGFLFGYMRPSREALSRLTQEDFDYRR